MTRKHEAKPEELCGNADDNTEDLAETGQQTIRKGRQMPARIASPRWAKETAPECPVAIAEAGLPSKPVQNDQMLPQDKVLSHQGALNR